MTNQSSTSEKIVPVEVRDVFVEPWSPGKLVRLMTTFGPAAIVASVAIGAGETIVVVQAGAWAGYGLMWLVLLSVLVKGVFVTYLLGRYTAVSGEPLSQRLARLPGPRGWLLATLVVLELAAAGPLWAAIARPCGNLIHHLAFDSQPVAPTNDNPASAQIQSTSQAPAAQNHAASQLQIESILSTLFIAFALLLSLLLTYEKLEKQQVIICGILVLGTLISTLMVHPDYAAALKGCLSWGHVPDFPSWAPDSAREHTALTLTTIFGYVGGTAMGYIVYANWISLHGWGLTGHPRIDEIRRRAAAGRPADYLPDDPASVRHILRSIAPLKWDVGCGAVVLGIVTVSFMVAGAAVLYPLLEAGKLDGVFTGWSLLTDQAYIWRNVHESLIWVYYTCVLVALWGTLQAFPEIYSRVLIDFGKAICPQRRWSRRRVQGIVSLYVFASSTLVIWCNLRFDMMIHIVAFLATILAVAVAMFAAIYLNFQLPRAYRTRWWMLAGGIASAIILAVVSVISGAGVWDELSQAWRAAAH